MKRTIALILAIVAAVVLITAGMVLVSKRRATAPAPTPTAEREEALTEDELLSELPEMNNEDELDEVILEEVSATETDLDTAENAAGESVQESNQKSSVGPTTQSFTIEADDSGFYPSGTITVSRGARVTITFSVRSTGVYFNGLDIKSQYFTTGAVRPGTSKTVTFTAPDASFTFSSYWPNSNVKKADGQVVVQ